MLQRTLHLYRDSFQGLSREIWYLAATLFVNRAGNMVIPFLTLYLTQQRGFSLSRAGIVMACFGLGSVTGSYIGGRLTERFGFYRVQLWSLIGTGLLFFGIMYLEEFLHLCIGVAILSTVGDCFRPASHTAIAYYSTPANRVRAYGLTRLAINLGFSAGPFMAGALIAGLGYHSLFIVDGFTCLGASLFFFLRVPHTGAETEKLPEPTDKGQSLSEDEITPYKDSWFLLFVFFYFLGALCFVQFFSTFPVYLKEDLFFTEWEIGALEAVNGIMIVMIEMPLVHWFSTHHNPMRMIITGALLYGISFLLLPLSSAWSLIPIVFIVLLTFGEMLKMPFASTWVANRSEGKRRGLYMGVYGLGFSAAIILAPPLSTWLAEHYGFPALWMAAGGFGLASAVGMMYIRGNIK